MAKKESTLGGSISYANSGRMDVEKPAICPPVRGQGIRREEVQENHRGNHRERTRKLAWFVGLLRQQNHRGERVRQTGLFLPSEIHNV
mgnify:CR=1 FL=1